MKVMVKDVTKRFQGNKVLDHISMEMEGGNIYGLLGASGSGKTTLLRIIMGASVPEEGTVFIEGIRVPDKRLLDRVGFMPQQDALYQELSVWDNLKFFGGIQRIRGEVFTRKARELLAVVGLSGEEKKLVRNCSGGMKKRISLAAALIHSPGFLILDEPTVGIDPVLRRQIWNYLQELKKSGITILMTTHVMDEIQQCDYAVLLRNGKIMISGTIENLTQCTSEGSIEALFFMGEETDTCILS